MPLTLAGRVAEPTAPVEEAPTVTLPLAAAAAVIVREAVAAPVANEAVPLEELEGEGVGREEAEEDGKGAAPGLAKEGVEVREKGKGEGLPLPKLMQPSISN